MAIPIHYPKHHVVTLYKNSENESFLYSATEDFSLISDMSHELWFSETDILLEFRNSRYRMLPFSFLFTT